MKDEDAGTKGHGDAARSPRLRVALSPCHRFILHPSSFILAIELLYFGLPRSREPGQLE
jgi:hypothetical protein